MMRFKSLIVVVLVCACSQRGSSDAKQLIRDYVKTNNQLKFYEITEEIAWFKSAELQKEMTHKELGEGGRVTKETTLPPGSPVIRLQYKSGKGGYEWYVEKLPHHTEGANVDVLFFVKKRALGGHEIVTHQLTHSVKAEIPSLVGENFKWEREEGS